MTATRELVDFSLDKNLIDFTDTFQELMKHKVIDALEGKKLEIARSLYSEEEPENDISDDEEESFDFDDDLDLEDLEDLENEND